MTVWLITQRLERNRHGDTVDVLEHAYLDFFVPRVGRVTPVSNHGARPSPAEYGGVIIAGGGDLPRVRLAGAPSEAGADEDLSARKFEFQSALVRDALDAGRPILAICYGFQLVNVVLGGMTHWDVHDGRGDRRPGLPHAVRSGSSHSLPMASAVMVNSFHAQGIRRAGLAPELEPLVMDADFDVVEAARHRSRPLLALQWHPERESPEPNLGAAMIDDFLAGRGRGAPAFR